VKIWSLSNQILAGHGQIGELNVSRWIHGIPRFGIREKVRTEAISTMLWNVPPWSESGPLARFADITRFNGHIGSKRRCSVETKGNDREIVTSTGAGDWPLTVNPRIAKSRRASKLEYNPRSAHTLANPTPLARQPASPESQLDPTPIQSIHSDRH
jgi:hypothetical protein